jgi:hypothetical protein
MSEADSNTTAMAIVDDPHDDIAVINRRIDDLIAGQRQSTAWYRNPSFITSAAAIFISVATTAMSWYRTYQQDITSLQSRLASTLQQANLLQIQSVDLMAKYKDDQPRLLHVSSTLTAQNLILSKQAYTLARALGSSAGSVNLLTIAYSLMQSNEVTLADDLLRQAIARAENSVEYGGALRTLGLLQYYNGQRSEGEATFKKALDTFKLFPKEAKSQDYVNYHHAYTHYYWAQALVSFDCRAAKDHLAEGLQLLGQMSPLMRQRAASTEGTLAQMNQQLTASCQ